MRTTSTLFTLSVVLLIAAVAHCWHFDLNEALHGQYEIELLQRLTEQHQTQPVRIHARWPPRQSNHELHAIELTSTYAQVQMSPCPTQLKFANAIIFRLLLNG